MNGHPVPVEPDWLGDAVRESAEAADLKIAPKKTSVTTDVYGGLTVLRWADILAGPAEPPPQIALGIPKVGLTVLAGPPKIGKTLYSSQIGLEIPRATFVIEEGSLAGIGFRLRRQAEALGIDLPDVEVLHRQGIRLDNRTSVSALRAYVKARRPPLLTLDPLNRLHGADENRPTQMTPIMDALASIAYDFECAVLAIHHLAKPSIERRGDVWDRFRGASSIRSGTDANLILDGTNDRVRLVGEFRDSEPLSAYFELDREALIFRPTEGPKVTGKVDLAALVAFAQERGKVTAREVMEQFKVSRNTALTALEAADLDRGEGVRGTLIYFPATVQ